MSEDKKELSEQELEQASGGGVDENFTCERFLLSRSYAIFGLQEDPICKYCGHYNPLHNSTGYIGKGVCLIGKNQ